MKLHRVEGTIGFSRTNLDWFFGAIEPHALAYTNPEFAFLVHVDAEGAKLVASRLVFAPLTLEGTDREVEAGAFYGCRVSLKSLNLPPRELLEELLRGRLPSPSRTIVLTQQTPHQPLILRENDLRAAVQPQKQLRLSGFGLSEQPRLGEDDDWALRACATPYHHVADLKSSLGLLLDRGNQLEVVAAPPLLIDINSRVRGDVAELAIRCLMQLPKEEIRFGYIVRPTSGEAIRGSIKGSELDWQESAETPEVLVGSKHLPVAKASVVQCFAVYGGQCLHHYMVGDPDAHQNPYRTILEVFDPGLEATRDSLQQLDKGQQLAHESGVAAVLWALGFAPVRFGRGDAPDIVATSYDGHVVVVECTLGDVKTKRNNKLQKLIDRTRDVRAALDRSNAGNRICIPVLVTARKRGEIEDDVAECERRGVVVCTHEDIEPLLGQSLFMPASDIRFKELKQRLDEIIKREKAKLDVPASAPPLRTGEEGEP